MFSNSVQISPEDAQRYAAADQRQREAQAQDPASALRVNVSDSYAGVSMHGEVNASSYQRAYQTTTIGTASDGVVGSLGMQSQHPNAAVTLPSGIQMSLEQAYKFGFVGKDSSGRYYDLDGSKKNEVTHSQPQAFEDDHTLTTSPMGAAHTALSTIAQSMEEHHVDRLMESAAIHALGEGDLSGFGLEEYASVSG